MAAGSLVGEEPWSDLIRPRLEHERIDTAAHEAASGLATSTTAVLIDPSGERSFAHHVGACASLDLAWIRRQLPALPQVDLSVPSLDEAAASTGCRALREIIDR